MTSYPFSLSLVSARARWFGAWLLVVPLCLIGCRSQPDVEVRETAVYRQAVQIGQLADESMAVGEPGRAADLYLRALEHARRLDDPGLQVMMAERAARALLASGRAREVLLILDEAEIAAARTGQSAAELVLLRAATALRDGQAEVVLERLAFLIGNGSSVTAGQRLDALTLAAHAELDLGRIERADGLWRVAIGEASLIGTPSAAARTLRLEGRLAYATSQLSLAAEAYDLEAERWREAQAHLPMAQALARAANVYAELGASDRAADRALRAGLSLRAQRQDGAAAESLHLALAAAHQSADRTRERLARQALAEVRERLHGPVRVSAEMDSAGASGGVEAERAEDQSVRAE
ncbi:hypothetical protein [Mucisphaera sp.]|uniref:hypothetical protein n=1 Tax=Mucisphaera sp. TaxID=2913024 RepID=UPI003D0E8EFF